MRGYRGTLLLQNRRLLCAGTARFVYCKLNDVIAVHKLDTFTNSDSTNVLVHRPSLNSLGLGTPVQLHVTVRLSHECMFHPGENLAWQHYAVQVLQTIGPTTVSSNEVYAAFEIGCAHTCTVKAQLGNNACQRNAVEEYRALAPQLLNAPRFATKLVATFKSRVSCGSTVSAFSSISSAYMDLSRRLGPRYALPVSQLLQIS